MALLERAACAWYAGGIKLGKENPQVPDEERRRTAFAGLCGRTSQRPLSPNKNEFLAHI